MFCQVAMQQCFHPFFFVTFSWQIVQRHQNKTTRNLKEQPTSQKKQKKKGKKKKKRKWGTLRTVKVTNGGDMMEMLPLLLEDTVLMLKYVW